MKRALFIHGTDANTHDNWWPWIRRKFERAGYEIFAPDLPDNHTPNRFIYEQFLQNSGWDFSDNVIVGHSSGATTALNLLSSDWFPRVKTTIILGTFLNLKLLKAADWYESGQFDNLFLESYEPEAIKSKCNKFLFVHGNNDPYCDINDAKILCHKLGGEFIAVKDGHHLWGTSQLTEIPEMATALNNIL